MRTLAILALFAASTPWMAAQRTGAGFAHFSHATPAHGSPRLSGSLASAENPASFHRFHPGPYGDLLSSFGLFDDSLGDSSSYGYSAAAAPNFFLMPPMPSAAMIEDQSRPAAQPLMIELRGDRYVRVTPGEENTESKTTPAEKGQMAVAANSEESLAAPKYGTVPSGKFAASSSTLKPLASRELPPTILVFRDGHSESVRDYAIADGVIYARGNYYTDGYWNKKIEVSTLNVPQTVQSNQARGVTFLLPGAPNEVITRP